MLGFDRSSRIRWLGVALAVTLGPSITCVAQEVGFIDLTQIVARKELRYPAPRSDEVTDPRGSGSIVHGRHDDCDVPNAPKHDAALRTTLVWLDRDEYAVGDHPKFEVRIENVGAVPVEMPFFATSGRPSTCRSEPEVWIFAGEGAILDRRHEMGMDEFRG